MVYQFKVIDILKAKHGIDKGVKKKEVKKIKKAKAVPQKVKDKEKELIEIVEEAKKKMR